MGFPSSRRRLWQSFVSWRLVRRQVGHLRAQFRREGIWLLTVVTPGKRVKRHLIPPEHGEKQNGDIGAGAEAYLPCVTVMDREPCILLQIPLVLTLHHVYSCTSGTWRMRLLDTLGEPRVGLPLCGTCFVMWALTVDGVHTSLSHACIRLLKSPGPL